jgi:hypothetical protein
MDKLDKAMEDIAEDRMGVFFKGASTIPGQYNYTCNYQGFKQEHPHIISAGNSGYGKNIQIKICERELDIGIVGVGPTSAKWKGFPGWKMNWWLLSAGSTGWLTSPSCSLADLTG